MTSLLEGSAGAPTFWSCYTKTGDPLTHRYGDEFGESYEYDSNVRNSRQIKVGDVLVLRDNHLAYGWGVVTSIDDWPGEKDIPRCPKCGSSKVFPRARAIPRYRCSTCKDPFPEPRIDRVAVTKFAAHYGANWIDFLAPAALIELKPLFEQNDDRNAIRRLEPVKTSRFIEMRIGTRVEVKVDFTAPDWIRHGGFLETRVRMRRFQEQFRGELIKRYGDVCAVTGRQPLEVLDAAHLYSYAANPEHRARGGLLLRKDVHRLFDTMLLTIEPDSLHSRVAPALLKEYPSVRSLDGRPLEIAGDRLPDRDLLAAHSVAAHQRWHTLRADLESRRASA